MASTDQQVFEGLLARYMAPLQRLSVSYAQTVAEAQDLFQEIALALWTALPRFRGDSSERTWVYRVAHNTAISFVTSSRRRSRRESVSERFLEPASRDNPERDLLHAEKVRRLQRAIRELPLADRTLVLLYLEGVSAAEMETITGVSAGAVATRLTRARQRLSARIRGEEVTR
jgi:RNA polymerase sigma-70 factor (ECF subfamily)